MSYIKFSILIFTLAITFSACSDSSTQPETQFVQIFFKWGMQNELNTFDNTLQKDLVMDGVIKIKFWLTAEEQERILTKVNEVNFYEMPDTFSYDAADSIGVYFSPDMGEQILRIRYNSKDKTTVWKYPVPESESKFNELIDLRELIRTIIESKQEYKDLPAARGGYD